MAGYTKLFNSILASTVWREPLETRIVWITMLAMSDQYGVVEASVPGLADMARVSVRACREAVARLESPDPDSRSKELDGRRIIPIDGGWRLVNHAKYRNKMSADERREYQKVKQKQYRAERRLHGVDTRLQMSTEFTHTDPDTDQREERETRARTAPQSTPFVGNGGQHYGRIFLHHWQLEALMSTLGAEAEDFALDAWLDQLSHKADERRLVLDRRVVWPWVQGELREECERRGLAMAEPAIEPAVRRRGKTPMPDRSAAFGASGPSEWRCTHEPPCHSRMSCATVTARKCPHGPPCDDGGMCISRILEGDIGTAAEGVA